MDGCGQHGLGHGLGAAGVPVPARTQRRPQPARARLVPSQRARWRTPSRPDDEIADLSIEACAGLLPDVEGRVEFAHVVRWDPGWVLPAPGGYSDMRLLARSRETARRIHLAGDYFGGSTTNSALCSGERAAEHVQRAIEST